MEPGDDQAEERIGLAFARADFATAAGETMAAYGRAVLGYLLAITRDQNEADDAFGDVALALWTSLPSFRRECSFRTWVYRLAWSAALRRQRDRFRRRGRPLESADYARMVAVIRSSTAPHQRTEVKDQLTRLRRRLDREERALLALRLHRDMSWAEIAVALSPEDGPQLTAATARKRYERLKDKLQALAADQGLLDDASEP